MNEVKKRSDLIMRLHDKDEYFRNLHRQLYLAKSENDKAAILTYEIEILEYVEAFLTIYKKQNGADWADLS